MTTNGDEEEIKDLKFQVVKKLDYLIYEAYLAGRNNDKCKPDDQLREIIRFEEQILAKTHEQAYEAGMLAGRIAELKNFTPIEGFSYRHYEMKEIIDNRLTILEQLSNGKGK